MRLLPILLFVVLAVVLLLPALRRIQLPARRVPRALPDELVKDPVCQTYIVKSRAVRRIDAGGARGLRSAHGALLATGGFPTPRVVPPPGPDGARARPPPTPSPRTLARRRDADEPRTH